MVNTNIRYEVLSTPIKKEDGTGEYKYRSLNSFTYYSKRYSKHVTVHLGYLSDGATGARDLHSDAWWIHDVLCDSGEFDDGTKCTNWQASMILNDILKSEGRWVIDRYWKIATFLFGGGEARKNGMFKLK